MDIISENYNYLYEIVGRLVGLDKFSYDNYKNLIDTYIKTKDVAKKDKIRKFNDKISELMTKGNNPQFNRYVGKINAELDDSEKIKDYDSFFELGKKIDEFNEKKNKLAANEDKKEETDKEEIKEENTDTEEIKKEVKEESKTEEVKKPNKVVTKIFDGFEKIGQTKVYQSFNKNVSKVSKFFNNNKFGKILSKGTRKVALTLSVLLVGLMALAVFGSALVGANILALTPGVIIAIPVITGGYYFGKSLVKLAKKVYNNNRFKKAFWDKKAMEQEDELFDVKENEKLNQEEKQNENSKVNEKSNTNIFDDFDNQVEDEKKPIDNNDAVKENDKIDENIKTDGETAESLKDALEGVNDNNISTDIDTSKDKTDSEEIKNSSVIPSEEIVPVKKEVNLREQKRDYFENEIIKNPLIVENKEFMEAYEKVKIADEMNHLIDMEKEEKTLSQKLDDYKKALIKFRQWEVAFEDRPELRNNSEFIKEFRKVTGNCQLLGSDKEVSTFMNYLNNKEVNIDQLGIREQDISGLESKMTSVLIDAGNRINNSSKRK